MYVMQLYCHFDITAAALGATVRRMEDCLDVIKQWLTSNCLCVNYIKMERLPVVFKMATALVVHNIIRVTDATSTALRYVRNLVSS